jgi:2-dehydropantoate 2-reductase
MPETDPVAVIGVGAVGTLLAGALAAAGHPILACGRARLTSITVTTDTGSASYAVTWTDQPGDLRGVRWTVLATKIHDTAAAAGWLAALSPGQCLLAAQNGVSQVEVLACAAGVVGGSGGEEVDARDPPASTPRARHRDRQPG